MKITAGIRATANGAVDTYSDLPPTLKMHIARVAPEAVELAYKIQSGDNPHFTGNDKSTLDNFFNGVSEIEAAYKRHFGRGIPAKHLVAMAVPEWR